MKHTNSANKICSRTDKWQRHTTHACAKLSQSRTTCRFEQNWSYQKVAHQSCVCNLCQSRTTCRSEQNWSYQTQRKWHTTNTCAKSKQVGSNNTVKTKWHIIHVCAKLRRSRTKNRFEQKQSYKTKWHTTRVCKMMTKSNNM